MCIGRCKGVSTWSYGVGCRSGAWWRVMLGTLMNTPPTWPPMHPQEGLQAAEAQTCKEPAAGCHAAPTAGRCKCQHPGAPQRLMHGLARCWHAATRLRSSCLMSGQPPCLRAGPNMQGTCGGLPCCTDCWALQMSAPWCTPEAHAWARTLLACCHAGLGDGGAAVLGLVHAQGLGVAHEHVRLGATAWAPSYWSRR